LLRAQKQSATFPSSLDKLADSTPCVLLHNCKKWGCRWNFSARWRRIYW